MTIIALDKGYKYDLFSSSTEEKSKRNRIKWTHIYFQLFCQNDIILWTSLLMKPCLCSTNRAPNRPGKIIMNYSMCHIPTSFKWFWKINIFPHLQYSDEYNVLVDRCWHPHLRQVFTAGLEGQQQVSSWWSWCWWCWCLWCLRCLGWWLVVASALSAAGGLWTLLSGKVVFSIGVVQILLLLPCMGWTAFACVTLLLLKSHIRLDCYVEKYILSPTSISMTKKITREIVVWIVSRTTQAKWAATHLISVQNYWLMSSLSFCTREKAAGPVASGDRWIVRQI